MTVSGFMVSLVIGVSGASGAVARYLLGRFVAERVHTQFPLGTFIINITGSFCIGLVFALATQKLISPVLQAALATGFLGGYTTFSTMSWESTQLVRSGSTRISIFYLGSSLLLGLIAATLGLALGGML